MCSNRVRLRTSFSLLQSISKIFPKLLHLGLCHGHDVGLTGIPRCVVLVVVLRDVKSLQRLESRHDRTREHLGFVKLANIGFCYTALRTTTRTTQRGIPV